MSLLFPTLYRRRVIDVTVEDLQNIGVKGILLDVDNTLTTHDAPDLTAEVKEWLRLMNVNGYELIIVSNNKPQRVSPFAEKIGLPYCALARKPLPFGYRSAAKQLGVDVKCCVAIGDQIFTDILGANLSGMNSILLEPIQPEVEQKFIVFKRKIEKPLLQMKRERLRKEADYGEN